jgi:hypothetical protein
MNWTHKGGKKKHDLNSVTCLHSVVTPFRSSQAVSVLLCHYSCHKGVVFVAYITMYIIPPNVYIKQQTLQHHGRSQVPLAMRADHS